MVALLRNNESIADLKMAVQQQLVDTFVTEQPAVPEFTTLQTQLDARQDEALPGRQPPRVDIARFTDTPLYRVAAAPWTSTTTDDLLVSNLVTVFLTWEFPFYNWIDLDAFLDDMRKGSLKSSYCSPFLVNALLAAACPYSHYTEATPIHSNTSFLMGQFIDEAKIHLEKERSEPTVTTLQGLCFMMAASGMKGSDAEGYDYMQQAIAVYGRICSDYAPFLDWLPSSEADTMQRVLQKTCWGVFDNIIMSLGAWQKPSNLQPPPTPLTLVTTATYDWKPYPLSDQQLPVFVEELAYFRSRLSLIAKDINKVLYGDQNVLHPEERGGMSRDILELHARLVHWQAGLPAHLIVSEDAPPSVLTHQCVFRTLASYSNS